MNKIIFKKKKIFQKIFWYKNILKKNILKLKIKIINKQKFNFHILKKKIIFGKKKNKVKFCVFAGREKNINILHFYIELLLKKKIIDEYHIFNFTRNTNDFKFIKEEYYRLNNLFKSKVFIHNIENYHLLKKNNKINWSPFYTNLSNFATEDDVIIKCDDDILFIDIYSLKNAIKDRIKDKKSFIIHSNCINNGVCAYYQRDIYKKLKEQLMNFPKGGIMGILFEKPELAYAIHTQFCNDILLDINNLKKYIMDDIFFCTRISINFILLNGRDIKYLKNISYDDEYIISSFLPEKLLRPNKIKGDLITSHLSYTFQEKILLHNDNILNGYKKIVEKGKMINNYNIKYNLYKLSTLSCNNKDKLFTIKNWMNDKHFYIKNKETDQYLSIEYTNNKVNVSSLNKTIFEIKEFENNIIEIKLGIYYLTKYNLMGDFRNENIFLKYIKDETERYLIKEKIDNTSFYLKFKKYNSYITINNENKINLNNSNNLFYNKWIFERVDLTDEFIECKRFIKDNKFYYRNIKNNEIYSNHYHGWSIDNLLV